VGLVSNRQFGVAIGILMARNLYTQDQAFGHLRASSQHLNVKRRDIAAVSPQPASYPGRCSEGLGDTQLAIHPSSCCHPDLHRARWGAGISGPDRRFP
jgi:hypothetical protein